MAFMYPSALFDVILGTRATFVRCPQLPKNLRISFGRSDLPDLHSMADVVVTSGGYNSLMEAVCGTAQIVVCPVNKGMKDEQRKHALRLQKHYPITIASTPSALPSLLRKAMENSLHSHQRKQTLMTDGARQAAELIYADLGLSFGMNPLKAHGYCGPVGSETAGFRSRHYAPGSVISPGLQ
jgi:hypothetical protein